MNEKIIIGVCIILFILGIVFIITNLIDIIKLRKERQLIKGTYEYNKSNYEAKITVINKKINNLKIGESDDNVFITEFTHLNYEKEHTRLLLNNELKKYRNSMIKNLNMRGKCLIIILLSFTIMMLSLITIFKIL